jgi:IS30 family transposase
VAGSRLAFEEREEIAWRRDRGQGVREIARAIGRCPSTVSRNSSLRDRHHRSGAQSLWNAVTSTRRV